MTQITDMMEMTSALHTLKMPQLSKFGHLQATDIKVNIFTKGSNDEQGASKVASYRLEKEDATGIWKIKLTGEWKDYYLHLHNHSS